MDELKLIQSKIDDISKSIPEGAYLEIMNLLKKLHEKTISDEHIKIIEEKYKHGGRPCFCSVDDKIEHMLEDIAESVRYLRLIAKLSEVIHGED